MFSELASSSSPQFLAWRWSRVKQSISRACVVPLGLFGATSSVHAAALVVGGGGTFTNEGILDMRGGSYRTPGGFNNHGTVLGR